MKDMPLKNTINNYKNIILWGAGTLGRQILQSGLHIDCIWDQNFLAISSILNITVCQPLSGNYSKNDTLIIVCVGDEQAQNEIFNILRNDGYSNTIHANEIEESIISDKINNFRCMNQSIDSGGIVFIGDSIIEQFNLNKYFPESNIHNRGIGGDTISGLLKRLNESVFGLSPQKIFICIGTNDIAKNIAPLYIAEEMYKLVCKIYEKISSAEIYIISILPVYSGDDPCIDKCVVVPRTNELIRETNRLITEATGKFGVTYIDIHSRLIDDSGQLDIDLTLDGLHLNPCGYDVFAQKLKEYI